MAEGLQDSATGTRKRKRKTEDDCPIPVEKRATLKDKGSTEEELKTPQASSSQQERAEKDQPPIKKRPHREEDGLSTEGVRKYFFFIKENVSSDWKDLAFHLGFVRADTDNIASRNRDDKSRCMDLLEEWLKRNGEIATIEVLMKALSDANLLSTADGLKTKYPELKTAQASSSQQQIKDVFQKAVKKHYELNLTSFKPLIWNDNFTLNLSDIFTQLELIPTGAKRVEMFQDFLSGQGTKLHSLDDLFNPNVTGLSTAPRCILIEGEAGGGKTTFLSKEALDAVSKTTKLGRRHDFVFLIGLRDVREEETIEEMVLDKCVPTTKAVNVESIRAMLENPESRVLFLLDGYDELRPQARAIGQAIPKLLSGKLYPDSTIVITSRPSAGVQQYTIPDCHVQIMGFSRTHVEEYVRQYFSTIQISELGERLTTALNANRIVADLVHTPIFLLLICVLWEEDQDLVSIGTMTYLYNNLLKCLVRKLCKREGVDMPTEGLPTEVAESLLQFGKLALEALLRNETHIDLTKVERENVNWKLLLNLGLVFLDVSTSKWHPRKQLNFSHKTMQEFLAGRYVAHAVEKQDIVELVQLTSISKAQELSNLLQFTCGCDSRAALAVMDKLHNLSGKEFSRVQPDDFQRSHMPVTTETGNSAERYVQFVLLCLAILNERKDTDILQAVDRALSVIIMDLQRHVKQCAGLAYYLENIRSSHRGLQDKVILTVGEDEAFQYLQQIFASPIGLQLDLKLENVKFGTADQTARLASVLRNTPGLRALTLSYTRLTPSSIQSQVLGPSHMSLLEDLDLSNNLELGDAGIEVLQFGLSSVPQLAVLRLAAVGMTSVGISSLAPHMRHLIRLRELDISDNDIRDNGLISLIAVLLHLTAIKLLKIGLTGITDNGISTLVKGLPHLAELQVLDVCGNDIQDSGIVSVVETLCQSNSMDVDQPPSGDNSMTTAHHHNTTLQELRIGFNRKVTVAGLWRVVQLISALPALIRLDMSGHWDIHANLPDFAAMALAQALPRLPALEWLDLRCVSMKPAGFQAVMQAAEKHPTLNRLVFSKTRVPGGADTSAGCLALR